MQILQGMNDLINYDAEPQSYKNVEDNEMELLNNMENMEADKVKYEGMIREMKAHNSFWGHERWYANWVLFA